MVVKHKQDYKKSPAKPEVSKPASLKNVVVIPYRPAYVVLFLISAFILWFECFVVVVRK